MTTSDLQAPLIRVQSLRVGFHMGKSGTVQAVRGVIRNIGERFGCVVTTPTGVTGSRSRSSTRKAATSLASDSVASVSANCAPMQTRGPTPNGR